MIQPLGEQIIIKVITQEKVGGIIIPDDARSATMLGSKGAEDAVSFVEAEVIAVGPGRRAKGDKHLVHDLWNFLLGHPTLEGELAKAKNNPDVQRNLGERVHNQNERLPLAVKPGDRILYHPAVISFDREVDGIGKGKHYIIREDSVLAVLEP